MHTNYICCKDTQGHDCQCDSCYESQEFDCERLIELPCGCFNNEHECIIQLNITEFFLFSKICEGSGLFGGTMCDITPANRWAESRETNYYCHICVTKKDFVIVYIVSEEFQHSNFIICEDCIKYIRKQIKFIKRVNITRFILLRRIILQFNLPHELINYIQNIYMKIYFFLPQYCLNFSENAHNQF